MEYGSNKNTIAEIIDLYINKSNVACIVMNAWSPFSDSWSGDTGNGYHVYACFRFDSHYYKILGLTTIIHLGYYRTEDNPKVNWVN